MFRSDIFWHEGKIIYDLETRTDSPLSLYPTFPDSSLLHPNKSSILSLKIARTGFEPPKSFPYALLSYLFTRRLASNWADQSDRSTLYPIICCPANMFDFTVKQLKHIQNRCKRIGKAVSLEERWPVLYSVAWWSKTLHSIALCCMVLHSVARCGAMWSISRKKPVE